MLLFFFNITAPTEIYTLSLHDALPISILSHSAISARSHTARAGAATPSAASTRSEEHTSELQSRENLVCRLLLEKKKYMLSDNLAIHLAYAQSPRTGKRVQVLLYMQLY